MGRVRDFTEDAGLLLTGIMIAKWLSDMQWNPFKREPWWDKEHTPRGGRGSGPDQILVPSPAGAEPAWSEKTMRLFVQQMQLAQIDPRVVLHGIAAASNFNADEQLGDYVGLLMVKVDDLALVGYPGVPPFEELDAPGQIPWIARVIAYRMADTGSHVPQTVPELALLLHQASNPNIAQAIRNEAQRRADEAEASPLYQRQREMLQHVLAHPDPNAPDSPWGPSGGPSY
jgi:hypothetical protein